MAWPFHDRFALCPRFFPHVVGGHRKYRTSVRGGTAPPSPTTAPCIIAYALRAACPLLPSLFLRQKLESVDFKGSSILADQRIIGNDYVKTKQHNSPNKRLIYIHILMFFVRFSRCWFYRRISSAGGEKAIALAGTRGFGDGGRLEHGERFAALRRRRLHLSREPSSENMTTNRTFSQRLSHCNLLAYHIV